MNLEENDTVYLEDGTPGTVIYVYKYESVAAVEVNGRVTKIPLHKLTKEKPDAGNN